MSDSREYVWIGEAFNAANERLFRTVHINEEHCRHDIETLVEGVDHARVEVERERLRHATGEVPA